MLDKPHAEKTASKCCSEKAPAAGPLSFLGFWSPAANDLGTWNQSAINASETIAQSWLKFLSERMAKDSALPAELAACKTFNDVYELYAQFWQQTSRDYAREFTTIADAVWGAVREPLRAIAPDTAQPCAQCSSTRPAAA